MKKVTGPIPQSCLTCRRRRKKCDRVRPACQRCVVGGFQCLGYDSPDKPPKSPGGEQLGDYGLAEKIDQIGSHERSPWSSSISAFDPAPATASSSRPSVGDLLTSHVESPIALVSAYELDQLLAELHLNVYNSVARPHSLINPTDSCYPTQTLGPPVSIGDLDASGFSDPSSASTSIGTNTSYTGVGPSISLSPVDCYPMNTQIMQYLHVLPRELSPLSANTTKIIDFVLAQYSRLFNLSYFSGAKTSGCQWSILQRVFTMGTTRCIMFVAAKIMDSFLDGTLLEKSSQYSYLIDRVELETCSSTEDPTYYEASTRLIDTMELAFIKTRVRSQFDTFQLLRSMAPVFLKIVALDSSLWPSQHKFSVSLAHVLASDRRELEHFVLLDMLYAMTHGLPQAIIYDTSVPAFTTQIVPFCGFPVELQIVLADINARCAQGYAAHDWRRLEKRIFAWEPPVCAAVDEDGWKISAQLAIHESWRHTMLIYLYMAICGVASDDPRVQSSVKQVFQLISSTKGPNRVPIDPHFFIQYIVAGACARSEKQRAMARNQLVDLVESRSWFWRGSDFIPLLDHLWHGAAINGRPIRWSDYIASRQATLPVGT